MADLFVLHIMDIDLHDAGSYKCGNDFMANLVVITRPICQPMHIGSLQEDVPQTFQCIVRSEGGPPPQVQWIQGNQTGKGTVMEKRVGTRDQVEIVNTFVLTPRFYDNGKKLICDVTHPWEKGQRHKGQEFPPSAPIPSCGHSHLDVLHVPHVRCTNPQMIEEGSKNHKVYCSIYANPDVPISSVYWEIDSARGGIGPRKPWITVTSKHE